MKRICLALLALLCYSFADAQCYPEPISSTSFYVPVAGTATFANSISGGTWSVHDTSIAVIDPGTGVLRGKAMGTTTVTYNMPGACELFYSTTPVWVTTCISGDTILQGADTTTLTLPYTTTYARWWSADTTVATIDASTGLLVANNQGMVDVYCRFTTGGYTYTTSQYIYTFYGINGLHQMAVGQALTFVDSVGGGNWFSSDTSIASIDSNTGALQCASQGTVNILYRKTYGAVTASVPYPVYVGQGITFYGQLCAGGTTTITDSVSGGTWSCSDTSIATINPTSGFTTGRAVGSAILTYSVPVSGRTYFAFDSIHIIPVPVVAHLPSTLVSCSGDDYFVPDGYRSFIWSSSIPAAIYVYDFSMYPYIGLRDSTYSDPVATVLYYVSPACSSVSDSIAVTIDPVPNPPDVLGGGDTICSSGTTVFSSSYPGGIWSTWASYYCVISSSGVVSCPHRDSVLTYFDVDYTITNSFGCSSSAYSYIFVRPSVDGGYIAGASSVGVGIIGNYFDSSGYYDSSGAWSITPTSIATISSIGEVTTLTPGTAYITHVVYGVCGSDTIYRTITLTPPAIGGLSSHFIGFVNDYCAAPQFGVSVYAHATPFSVVTYYGDGTKDTTALPASSATVMTNWYHSYGATGTYSIKQVLMSSGAPIDSVSYSYTHLSCNAVSLNFYVDADHDCAFHDTIDYENYIAMRVEIDSNGVAIDTLPVTSGMYYEERGTAGDVYSYRVLSSAVGISCPSSGVITDTLVAGTAISKHIDVAMTCGSTGFDLSQNTAVGGPGRHAATVNIAVDNDYCTGHNGTLNLTFDSRYNFSSASITPTSVSGSTARWNLSDISDIGGIHPFINVELEVPGTGTSGWLLPGTLVDCDVRIIPDSTDDLDTSNNHCHRVDTVKSSWDPNKMDVSPAGNILNGTKLKYTIEFENDGNDTAHNIYVMDTLPNGLQLSSMQIVTATARMNTSIIHSGGYTIVKFDFPHINLPDSSNYLHCRGMVVFNINAMNGLADGMVIRNHAGIFFDDNAVVMTDTSVNVIVVPSLSISGTYVDTICHAASNHFNATSEFVPNHHYQWYVNNTAAGTDSIGFTSSSLAAGDSVTCVMTNMMDDTIHTVSNTLHLIVRATPSTGVISGPSTLCPGQTIHLSETVPGGVWSTRWRFISVSDTGTVTAIAGGADTVLYSLIDACGTYSTFYPITITPLAPPSVSVTASPSGAICEGDTVALAAHPVYGGGLPVYIWEKRGMVIGTGATLNYAPIPGDIIDCRMASDYTCRAADTVESPATTFSVNPSVSPTVSIISVPSDTSATIGQTYNFYTTVTYGGTVTTYQWFLNGVAVAGATGNSYTSTVYGNETVVCLVSGNPPCAATTSGSSNPINLVVATDGVAGVSNTQHFTLYPNPNTGNFRISGTIEGMDGKDIAFEIRDVLSRVVYSGSLQPQNGVISQNIQLQNDVTAGYYFLRLLDGAGSTFNFVINK